MKIYWILLLSLLFTYCLSGARKASEALSTKRETNESRYLHLVRNYAETMIDRGRDRYGPQPSPLFATTLERQDLTLPTGDFLRQLENIPRASWGIRSHDRMLTGANPMHDQNLYQILYALSRVTGQDRYAQAADETLKWFFEHCQSAQTGLMAWGEHIGWDFNTETIIDKEQGLYHEFFRPWVLWDQCYQLNETACLNFAKGLWLHQIHDHETGEFSRHANWDVHKTGTQNQYPRHGGFYIATWAEAYRRSRDPIFLKAIETLYQFYDRHKSPQTGAIPGEVSNPRSAGNSLLWPQSNLSLAIDLWEAAAKIPEPLSRRLIAMATSIDRNYLRVPHDLSENGEGFVTNGNTHTLAAEDVRSGNNRVYSDRWTTGYGQFTDAQGGNLCMLRYRQTKDERYQKLIIAAADRYLTTGPNTDFPIYPGTLGDVIHLLLNAYELTGKELYHDRAHHFAELATDLFFDASSPLPKASSQHDHYEAVTRADNLMMALLRLSLWEEKTKKEVSLLYTER